MNEDEGLPERWKIWKLQFHDFRTPARLSSAEKGFQTAMFRHAIGEQAVPNIDTFSYEADKDPEDWEKVMNKVESHCLGFRKDNFERYEINCRVQESGEYIDQFVQSLRSMVTTCGFRN
ncbi:hypothetical protein PHET_12243 [Paragonimus heterotremus]|uniref:Uncharacterized protein n=1 Tax=Paragonimus heterotremus TaxID=100268 RepID=A0A8J4SPG6_9TREM|nr:hypothetical protein PHET_12243 [Paragonimus heterotremus]